MGDVCVYGMLKGWYDGLGCSDVVFVLCYCVWVCLLCGFV